MASVIDKTIEQQDWLAPVESGLGQVADATLGGEGPVAQKVRNFLHGVWLGHPLHPALTDLPIGAWTTAAILDLRAILTGDKSLDRATRTILGIGILGAAGAATAGLNDWRQTDGRARRTGALHGLLNSGALALFGTSWLLRRRNQTPAGRLLSFLGLGLASFSAYLGGRLVYDERIGVDHAPRQELPDDFVTVMDENELAEGVPHHALVNGIDLVLVRRGQRIFALAGNCAHLGGPLYEGQLEGTSLRCPWHGSRFDLETGQVLDGPAAFAQPCLEVRVRLGQIEVRRREGR